MASNLTEAEWLLASDDLKVSFNMLSQRIMQLPQKNVQLNAGVFVCLNFRLEDCYYVEYFSWPRRHGVLSKTGKGGEVCFICQQPSAPCVRWEGMKCTPKCSLAHQHYSCYNLWCMFHADVNVIVCEEWLINFTYVRSLRTPRITYCKKQI